MANPVKPVAILQTLGSRLRILLLHNYYLHAGGEDMVFADDANMLEENGHTVFRHTVHNDVVHGMSSLTVAGKTLWNAESYQTIYQLVRRDNIDIVHAHNTFPLLSPAVYSAARRAGAAVVQTLHNYRFACANALLYRNDAPCEKCVGKLVPWPAVVHSCYRDSRAGSAVLTGMLATHRVLGTYQESVDAYICLTEFAREIFIRAGLPRQKLFIRGNMVHPDPGAAAPLSTAELPAAPAVFVGRLGPEKGLPTLLEAWDILARSSNPMPLKIIGDGPLIDLVRAAAAKNPAVQYLGRQNSEQVYAHLAAAAVLAFPSVVYEGLPKTILEAFAKGTPVVASARGSAQSLVTPGQTGLHFKPQDAADLAAKISWCRQHPHELAAMRPRARQEYLNNFTMPTSYARLMEIYAHARGRNPMKRDRVVRRQSQPNA